MITKIELKNGILIDCKDKLIKMEKKINSDGFIIILSSDSVKAGNNGFNYKTFWNELRIPVKDIMNIQMEKTESNNTLILVIVLGVLALGLIIFLIAFATTPLPN